MVLLLIFLTGFDGELSFAVFGIFCIVAVTVCLHLFRDAVLLLNSISVYVLLQLIQTLFQDAAQVVSSSMCLTSMEKTKLGDLYVSCNMRCLEVGTVGGGTILPAQRSCLEVRRQRHFTNLVC